LCSVATCIFEANFGDGVFLTFEDILVLVAALVLALLTYGHDDSLYFQEYLFDLLDDGFYGLDHVLDGVPDGVEGLFDDLDDLPDGGFELFLSASQRLAQHAHVVEGVLGGPRDGQDEGVGEERLPPPLGEKLWQRQEHNAPNKSRDR
jgi:hypothetical protein